MTAVPGRMPESSITITASPHGTRAGFAALADGAGGTVTFTVLPKPWAPVDRAKVLAPAHVAGATTHLALFELDTVVIPCSEDVKLVLSDGIIELADLRGQNDLLARVGAVVPSTSAPTSRGTDFEALVSLLLMARRQRISVESIGYSGAAAPSLLRLITQHLFVEEVGRVLDHARPAYREKAEVSASPRGKLSGRSLAVALLTRSPRVEANFDELTTDTPVLRIVLAVLRAVATDRSPAMFRATAGAVRGRATAFAHRLGGVAVVDPARALLAATRLAITPLDRPWTRAVELAAEVLSARATVPQDGKYGAPRAAGLIVSMEKWWEQSLAEALRIMADPGTVREQEQIRVRRPWRETPTDESLDESDSASKPDLLFALDGVTVLGDAKYKLGRGLAAADAYQLFAYSHLARRTPGSAELTDRGVVLYPLRTEAGRPSRSHRKHPMIRATSPRYELSLLDLPFPSQADVLSDEAWRDYIAGLAGAIRAGLGSSRPISATLSRGLSANLATTSSSQVVSGPDDQAAMARS